MSANNFLKAFSNFIKNPSAYAEDPLSNEPSRVPSIQVDQQQEQLSFQDLTEELVVMNDIREELRVGHRTVCTVAAQLGFTPARVGHSMAFTRSEVQKIKEESVRLKRPQAHLGEDDQEFDRWLAMIQVIRSWHAFPKDRYTNEDVLQLIGQKNVKRFEEAKKYLEIEPFKYKSLDVYSEEQIRKLRELYHLSLEDLQRLNGSSREESLPIEETTKNVVDLSSDDFTQYVDQPPNTYRTTEITKMYDINSVYLSNLHVRLGLGKKMFLKNSNSANAQIVFSEAELEIIKKFIDYKSQVTSNKALDKISVEYGLEIKPERYKQEALEELKKENPNPSDNNLHYRISKAVERIDELQKNYEVLAKRSVKSSTSEDLEKNLFFRDSIVNVHSEITKSSNRINGRLDHLNKMVTSLDRKVVIQDQCLDTLDKNFSKLEAKSEKLHQTVSTNVDNLVQKVEAIPENEFTKEWMKSIDNSLIDHNYSILELKNSKPTVQDSSSTDLETAIKSLELKEKLFDEFAKRLSKMEESQNSINSSFEKAINGIVGTVQSLSKQISLLEISAKEQPRVRKKALDESSMFKNFSFNDAMEAVMSEINKEYSKKNGSATSYLKLARSYKDVLNSNELKKTVKELMLNGLLAAKDDSDQVITAFDQIKNLRTTWLHPIQIDRTDSSKVLKTTNPLRKVSLAELDVEFATNGFDEDTPLVAYETYLKSIESKEIVDKDLTRLYQQAAFLIDECNECFQKKQRGKCVKEIHHWYIDNEGHRSPKSIFRTYAALGYLLTNDQVVIRKKPNSHEYVVWDRKNFNEHRKNLDTQYVLK